MNQGRRVQLEALAEKLRNIHEVLQEVRDEEEEALTNMPDSLQAGDKGQVMADAVESMDEVLDQLDEGANTLEGLIQ